MLNYSLEVLQNGDTETLEEIAQVLADVFAGVKVGERFIQEPMITAAGITNKGFYEFTRDYLMNVAYQGLTVYARDNDTGRVIGSIASDAFNPNEEVPVFEGEQAGWNLMYPFLEDLDEGLIKKFEQVAERKMTTNDLVHIFLIGVKAEHSKGIIAKEMIDLTYQLGKEKGYVGMFAEATNPKSQKVLKVYNGCSVPIGVDGELVLKEYNEAPFDTIEKDVATACEINYRAIDNKYKLD